MRPDRRRDRRRGSARFQGGEHRSERYDQRVIRDDLVGGGARLAGCARGRPPRRDRARAPAGRPSTATGRRTWRWPRPRRPVATPASWRRELAESLNARTCRPRRARRGRRARASSTSTSRDTWLHDVLADVVDGGRRRLRPPDLGARRAGDGRVRVGQPDRPAPRRQRRGSRPTATRSPGCSSARPRGHPRVLPQRPRRADAALRRERRSPASTGEPVPEDGYQGEYIVELGARTTARRRGRGRPVGRRAACSPTSATTLESINIDFDEWFSQASLEESGAVAETLDDLRARGVVFERGRRRRGCAPTDFGDDKDRVLVKSDGEVTYLRRRHRLPPRQVRDPRLRPRHRRVGRRPPRLGGRACRPAIEALGHDPRRARGAASASWSRWRSGPHVEARRQHRRARRRCSTRSVPTRPGSLSSCSRSTSRRPSTSTWSRSQSKENPVFYVQFAHARIASIEPGRRRARRRAAAARRVDLGAARPRARARRAPGAVRAARRGRARARRAGAAQGHHVGARAGRPVPRLLPRLLRDG